MKKIHLFIETLLVLLLLTINISCNRLQNDVMKNPTIAKILSLNDDRSIYYNLETNSTVPVAELLMDDTRRPLFPVKFFSRGLPCSCVSLKCGCCAGLNITSIKLNNHVCANVTFVPEEFALDFDLIVNNDRVAGNRLTARNPPPVCVPLYFFPAITFCVRFFDLYFTNNKLNVCIDFETQIIQWPLLILHFNCLHLGGNGITWIRPQPEAAPLVITNVTHPEINENSNVASLKNYRLSNTSWK